MIDTAHTAHIAASGRATNTPGASKQAATAAPVPSFMSTETAKWQAGAGMADTARESRRSRFVLRHFFFEHFHDSAIWFSRRMDYTKSMATNSIVGYIVGLGDRHVNNILIDSNSAELVHIDLGLAKF